MKKIVMIVLTLLVAMPIQGRVKKNNKKANREVPKKMPRVHEPVYCLLYTSPSPRD